MKKLLFLAFISFSYFAECQYTAIPDPNFEQKLISLGYDNTLDGQVLTSIINQVTTLNVSNSNITNLTGIQGFTALTSLYCSGNSLNNINLSQNTNLVTLTLGGPSFNGFSGINLSQNLNLSTVELYDLQASTLNLDLSNTYIETVQLRKINVVTLTIGNSVNFSTLEYSYPFNNDFVLINNLNIINSPNFSAFSNNYGNSTSTISFDNISALNLQYFCARYLGLASLTPNCAQLNNLVQFFVDGCSLSAIDLSNHPNLVSVSASNSSLLNGVKICSPMIDSVNVSNSPNLSCLTIKSVMPLINDYFSIHAINVPNLNCIEVQDGTYFSILFPSNFPSNRIDLDPQISYSSNCANSCSFTCSSAGLEEIENKKELVKIVDSFGREVSHKTNQLMFHIYSDGSVVKIFQTE